MEDAKKIVVVGSNMMDLMSYAPRLPKEGETIHGNKFVTGFGGKGANQCVAAAKLGAKTAFVGRVGNDSYGEQYLANFKRLGVDTKYVWKTEGFSNGVAQIIVAEDGANQIVIIGGANYKLSVKDVETAKDLVENATVLVCQLETSPDVAIKAMELCKGISILNGAPAISNADPKLLTLPNIFCVNESEASVFTGLPVNNISEAKTAVINLLDKGCNSVILTLGSEGALYASQLKRQVKHIPCNKVKCVDSTGAGDAFIGALAYLLLEKPELNMSEVLKAACHIASHSVTKQGTQTSFPGPEVLEEFLTQS